MPDIMYRVHLTDGSTYVTDVLPAGDEMAGVALVEVGAYLDALEIGRWLDQDAEGANYHRLVGAHAWLAEQLVRLMPADLARTVMDRLADKGGLHGNTW